MSKLITVNISHIVQVIKLLLYCVTPQAIDDWEDAADLIIAREEAMAKLEKFERLASDPNRFFEKGNKLLQQKKGQRLLVY